MLVWDVCCVVTWHVIIFPSYKQNCLFTWRRSPYKSHKQGRWFGPPEARPCLPGWLTDPVIWCQYDNWMSRMPAQSAQSDHWGTEAHLYTHIVQLLSQREQVCSLSLSLSLSPINYLFFPACLRRLEQFLRQKEEKLKNGCRNWGFLCDGKPTQRTYTGNLVQIRNIEKHPVRHRGEK